MPIRLSSGFGSWSHTDGDREKAGFLEALSSESAWGGTLLSQGLQYFGRPVHEKTYP